MRTLVYSPFVLASGFAEVDVVHSAVNVVTDGLHLPQTSEDWGKLLGTCLLVIFYKAIDYLFNRVAFRKIAVQESVNVVRAAVPPAPENQPADSSPDAAPQG